MLPVGFSVWWGFPGTPGTFQAPFLAHFYIAPARPPGRGRLPYLLGALTPRRGRTSARVERFPFTVSVSVVPAGGRQPGGRKPRGCGLPNFDYPPRRTPLRLAQEGQPRHLLRAVSAGLCLSCIEIRFGNRPGYAEFSLKCRPEAHSCEDPGTRQQCSFEKVSKKHRKNTTSAHNVRSRRPPTHPMPHCAECLWETTPDRGIA